MFMMQINLGMAFLKQPIVAFDLPLDLHMLTNSSGQADKNPSYAVDKPF